MADKSFQVLYDLQFKQRGLTRVNRQLTAMQGKLNRSKMVMGTMVKRADRLAGSFRRVAIAVGAVGLALGYSLKKLSDLEAAHRKINALASVETKIMLYGKENINPGELNPKFMKATHEAGIKGSVVEGAVQQMSIYGIDAAKMFEGETDKFIKTMSAMNAAIGKDNMGLFFKGLGQASGQDIVQMQEIWQMREAGMAAFMDRAGFSLKKANRELGGTGYTSDELMGIIKKSFELMENSGLAEGQSVSVDAAFNRMSMAFDALAQTLGKVIWAGGALGDWIEISTGLLVGFLTAFQAWYDSWDSVWKQLLAAIPITIFLSLGVVLAGFGLALVALYAKIMWAGLKLVGTFVLMTARFLAASIAFLAASIAFLARLAIMGFAMLVAAGPIGWIVVALVALGAAVWYFKDELLSALDWVVNGLLSMLNWILSKLGFDEITREVKSDLGAVTKTGGDKEVTVKSELSLTMDPEMKKRGIKAALTYKSPDFGDDTVMQGA